MNYQLKNPLINSEYNKIAYNFLIESQIQSQFSTDQVNRIFERLISGNKNVLEIWKKDKKLITAVLIDRITNNHKTAYLEYLGFIKTKDARTILTLVLNYFESLLIGKKQFDALAIPFNPSFGFEENVMIDLGYAFFYKTYDLKLNEILPFALNLKKEFMLEKLTEDDFPEYYDVLVKCFADNIETSIGSLHDLWLGFNKQILPTYIVKESGRIIGFINIHIDKNNNIGHINTIGILPKFRHKGLGSYLLAIGVDCLWDSRVKSIELTASVNNINALSIYQNAGFKVKQESSVYRKTILRN